MMEKPIKQRTKSFLWDSKQQLYDYFEGTYGLRKEQVDGEIDEALKVFRLRQGEPINPQELWEKVGNALERRLTKEGGAEEESRAVENESSLTPPEEQDPPLFEVDI